MQDTRRSFTQTQKKRAVNSDFIEIDLVVKLNYCSKKEDSNSETASSKSAKECSLNSETQDVHAIKYKMSKAKERCMAYFRSLHSHLQVLSKDDLKGTRIEHGFKRAFMSLFGQDVDTFTRTMLLNVDQLQKQLDKDEFQEDGSMTAFWVVQHFRDTLLQHLGNVKKSVAERTRHQRQTDSIVQDDSSRSGNDTDADDADIRPIYNEEPMAEIYLVPDPNRDRNSKTSVMPSARFDSTADDSKPKPRSTNHSTRSFPISKSSCVMITVVPKADHSKSSSSFSDSKHFVCSTCHKCVFNANHDACITKLLKEVNSHAKIQSHKTRNSNKPVDQKSHTQKPGRQIFTRHRFSPNKTSAVYEKTSPRSDLRWKPTGRIFKSVGLRWIPTGKLFDSCTSKVDSEPPHGSNVDIPNIHECKQTLDVSAGTSINVQKEQSLDLSAGTLCNVNKENLRVYEDEMKRSSSSTSTSQNLKFLSSKNTSSTNEVSTASGDFGVILHAGGIVKSGRNQGRRSYGDNGRSNVPTNESSLQALVAQDGLGGYDWSNDFEVEPVNYALMAISSSSSSSSSDNEVQQCSKQCLNEYAIRKKIIESKTTELYADTSKSKTSETVGNTNEVNIEKPKSVNESVVSTPNINKIKSPFEIGTQINENMCPTEV
ncbi:hypothetical protein Tco_1236691 [Tanacetum coccineum]